METNSNKHFVVTGGVKGIGKATVDLLLSQGHLVSVLDIDSVDNKQSNQYADHVRYYSCDVSKSAMVQECIDRSIENFGEVDVLINAAGILQYATVTETSEEMWDHVMGVNLKGSFLTAKFCLPSMMTKGKGVIINISSVQAFLTQTQVAAYTTSKTALLGLTRSIAVDYGPSVRCVAVCPGTINTPMLQDAIKQSPNPEEVFKECEEMHLVKKVGDPAEVAEFICFLASDKASFITGQAFRIDGGLGVSIGGSKKD